MEQSGKNGSHRGGAKRRATWEKPASECIAAGVFFAPGEAIGVSVEVPAASRELMNVADECVFSDGALIGGVV